MSYAGGLSLAERIAVGNGLTSLGCMIMLVPVLIGLVALIVIVLATIPYIGWVLAGIVVLFALAAVVGVINGLTQDVGDR